VRGGGTGEQLTNIRQVLAAPEKLAVNDESGHAEHARRLGLPTNLMMLGAPRPEGWLLKPEVLAPQAVRVVAMISGSSISSSRRQNFSKTRS